MPTLIGWTRLEPQARAQNLDGGLRAEVHDPLWALARQWQLGEFAAEDVGSPIRAVLRMDRTPLTRYLPGGIPAAWLQSGPTSATGQRLDRALPLEMVVERERLRVEGAPRPRLAVEARLQLQALLTSSGLAALRADLVARFAFAMPDTDPEHPLDADTQRFLQVTVGRAPDGNLLASILKAVNDPARIASLTEPYRSRVSAGVQTWQAWLANQSAANRAQIGNVVSTWLAWYDTLLSEPDPIQGNFIGGNLAWQASRLEYELAASAPTPLGEVLLTAPEYTDGNLDWYSFDVQPSGSLGAIRGDLSATDVQAESISRTVIPVPAGYPGMPTARYWEFEDARIDFGSIAHLLLVEFALVYADDWFVIPVDAPVGTLCRVRWLVVSDTFGERILVASARTVDGGGAPGLLAWDLFRLATDPRPVAGPQRNLPDVLWLPPVLGQSLHGPTLEEIVLLLEEIVLLEAVKTLSNSARTSERRIQLLEHVVSEAAETAPLAPRKLS